MDRWVKGDTKVDTGPVVDVIDQTGATWTGDTWPPKPGRPLEAAGSGTLSMVAEGPVAFTARRALESVRRGIVVYGSL